MRIQTSSDQSNDRKSTQLLWIVGIAFGAMLGIGGTVTLSYGSTKQQVVENTEDILSLQRRSVDYVYIQDLIQSNYMLVDILKATPNSKEMEEALKAWKEFQSTTMRRANPTRSISSSSSNGASQ